MILRLLGIAVLALGLAACASDQDDQNAGSGDIKSVEDWNSKVQDRVYFGFDKYNLVEDAKSVLDMQANGLKALPDTTVVIEGHCDERGTREYNTGLGDRRANAVKKYLVAQGVDAARIETTSYGKDKPAVLGSSEDAWSQNRRGVTVLMEDGKEVSNNSVNAKK